MIIQCVKNLEIPIGPPRRDGAGHTITGGMTSTPGLAAADSMVDSNIPSVAYATVYPIAMVVLILFIQIIASAVY